VYGIAHWALKVEGLETKTNGERQWHNNSNGFYFSFMPWFEYVPKFHVLKTGSPKDMIRKYGSRAVGR
jgi:hypothetical protein